MKTISFTILLLLIGCDIGYSRVKNDTIHDKLITVISEKRIHSSIYISIPILEKNEYKQAIITNTQLHYEFYIPQYGEEISFKEYVYQLFTNEIDIRAENIEPEFIFSLNMNHIDIEYSKKGFDYIVKKYLNEFIEGTFSLETDLTEQELYTLIKICFYNNVIVTFDGYEDYFMFRDLSLEETK